MASKNSTLPPPLATDHDLWVLPSADHSRWFSHVDWYLNWQLSKGMAHQPQKLSTEMLRVMEENGIKARPELESTSAPLMVASEGHLPVAKCVVVNYAGGLKAWLKDIHELTEGLAAKRMRVFLPKGAEVSKASTLWKEITSPDIEVEFSPDEEAHELTESH